MEVQVVESGPCRRSLTIKIPTEKIKAHVDSAYKTASEQAQIKGFRPGKVPRRVLEKRYGEAILAEAKDNLVNDSFQAACKENKIAFIGKPEVEGVDDKPLDLEAVFEFQVHVAVRPEVTVERVQGIEVKAADNEVTDEDVKAGLDQLAEQKRSLQPIDDPVEDGDFVRADIIYKKDGETIHERKNSQLNTNIPFAGADPEVFKNKLIGAEKGKTIEMDLKFPDTFEKEEVRGEAGQVEIHVQDVMRVTSPTIDDEFAKAFEFDDLDALQERLRERIGEEKTQSEKNRMEQDVINTILQENPFEVPEMMVEDQKKYILEGLEKQMKEHGMDEPSIKAELQKHDGDAAHEADRKVRVYFLLDSIARAEKIFVTEGDVDVELRNIAAANNASPDDARKHYEENDLLGDLRLAIMERKVRDFLRESAKITDK